MTETNTTFDCWAVVEIMGHQRFAGHVTEQSIGGSSFLRIDVPECGERPAFTKLFGSAAVYAITPCTEETAIKFVEKIQNRAFSMYEAPRLNAPSPSSPEVEDDDDYDD